MTQRNYERALQLAMTHGVDFDTDFHAQSFGPWLSELAKKFGYRAPKNGSSSTGRHFFYLLKRLYDKKERELGEWLDAQD